MEFLFFLFEQRARDKASHKEGLLLSNVNITERFSSVSLSLNP